MEEKGFQQEEQQQQQQGQLTERMQTGWSEMKRRAGEKRDGRKGKKAGYERERCGVVAAVCCVERRR